MATDWSPAPEDVDSDFAKFVTDVGGEIDDLQKQIDGNITTWFYDAVPTTSNTPAKDWTTTVLKNQHLGDLYYDKNGYCYRWQLSGGTYGWTRITDTDVTTALSNAKKAQDTADGKRRVFVTTPVPPYDVGDMWAQGDTGELLRCATKKEIGESYDASDWVKTSKYTDDTLAKQAKEKIDNLQIGGRNLLLKSATKHISANSGATLAFTDGVSVAEWGATDAIRCTGTGGTDTTFGIMYGVSVNATSVSGQEYVHSIYIRNDGESRLRVMNNNLGGSIYVEVGESRRVVLNGTGNGEANLALLFRTATAGDAIDITYWHPKIELGNAATDWSPAPEDNPDMFTADTPPGLPLKTGTIWIDTGVEPTVIRRWKGTGTSTDRDEDGWDTVSDLDEINEISNKLRAQQAEAQKAIDRLATAITIDTEGAHFYKPGYRDRSEVRIDQDSVDILVGGNVNSSFIAGGLILGNYMLWHPAAAGGLAFNLM